MAFNIFYRIPTHHGTSIASIPESCCNIAGLADYLTKREGLTRGCFNLAYGTRIYRTGSCSGESVALKNNSHVDIVIPLAGGKGGFGSLLRAIGAQIEKTTNRDACRDLSGRRLRDVKKEEELKKLIALQGKLIEEKKRRKKEKLERLKKTQEASKASASIQELVSMFDDHAYNKRRLELSDIIDVAVEKGIINLKKRQLDEKAKDEGDNLKKSRLESDETIVSDGENLRTESSKVDTVAISIESTSKTVEQKPTCKTKKQDLWLGLEDDDSSES